MSKPNQVTLYKSDGLTEQQTVPVTGDEESIALIAFNYMKYSDYTYLNKTVGLKNFAIYWRKFNDRLIFGNFEHENLPNNIEDLIELLNEVAKSQLRGLGNIDRGPILLVTSNIRDDSSILINTPSPNTWVKLFKKLAQATGYQYNFVIF